MIRIARSEMGQGTLTGLAQLVAEELECDWSKVTTEFPTPGQNVARKRVWGNFSTGGSRGIRELNEYVRQGGAAARDMLIRAAAAGWGVPAAECSAANSVITHKPSGRTTTYGKVAEAAAKLEPPKDIKLKDPKDWKIAGKPLKRLDTADKVNGKQVYGIDLKLPGMLIATIRDCPVPGGKVKSFDAAKVESMRGVKKVVPVGDTGVAVVADNFWNAKTALAALPIVWDEGPNAKVYERHDRRHAEGGSRRRAGLCRQQGGRRQGGARRRGESGRGGLQLPLPAPRDDGADERHRALYRRTNARSGARRRTARRRSPRSPRRRACRSPNATSTRCCSAAASAGAARSPTLRARRCRSPCRCRARRSS